MFFYYLLRWTLFLIVGLPVQVAIIYPLWIILLPYYLVARLINKGDLPVEPAQKWTLPKLIEQGKNDPVRHGVFMDVPDDHSALIHGYWWALETQHAPSGLRNLIDDEHETLHRRSPDHDPKKKFHIIYNPVSGDCLASWAAAATYCHFDGSGKVPKKHLRTLINSYIKNCFGLPARQYPGKKWLVSNRSSNSGINYTYDSWGKFNQPCLGTQYYTSAALLKLACNVLGGWYWGVYFLHYWLMGGWLWQFLPMYHTHSKHLYDAQHVTAVALYSVAKNSWNPIYRWTQWWMTCFMAPRRFVNPLFECYRANCGNTSWNDIESALDKCTRFKHVWPQVWTGWVNWYNEDGTDHPLTGRNFGVVAGAAKMLWDELERMKATHK